MLTEQDILDNYSYLCKHASICLGSMYYAKEIEPKDLVQETFLKAFIHKSNK